MNFKNILFQFLNLVNLSESFKRMSIQQQYRKFRPETKLRVNPKLWWHYAFTVVVEKLIRPFSWSRIKAHRWVLEKNIVSGKVVFEIIFISYIFNLSLEVQIRETNFSLIYQKVTNNILYTNPRSSVF